MFQRISKRPVEARQGFVAPARHLDVYWGCRISPDIGSREVAAEIPGGLPATRKLTHYLTPDFALSSNFLWANLTLFAIPSENGGVKPPLQPDALAKARAAYQDFLTL